MDINDIRKHVESLGCNIVKQTAFSLVSKCGDDAMIIKEPNARIKVLVNSNLDPISKFMPIPKNIVPRDISIAKLEMQGTLSRLMKLHNLDEVEYVFGKDDIEKIGTKNIKSSLSRIERANAFTMMPSHDGINPASIVSEEAGNISKILVDGIEEKISTKVGNNVLCGATQIINPAYSDRHKKQYQFLIKVNCKVPAIFEPVTRKVESIGAERMFSESDRFFVKSITPPSGDLFLSGLKLKSQYGENQLEFEVIDNNKIKKKDFLDNIKEIKIADRDIPGGDDPVDIERIVSMATPVD